MFCLLEHLEHSWCSARCEQKLHTCWQLQLHPPPVTVNCTEGRSCWGQHVKQMCSADTHTPAAPDVWWSATPSASCRSSGSHCEFRPNMAPTGHNVNHQEQLCVYACVCVCVTQRAVCACNLLWASRVGDMCTDMIREKKRGHDSGALKIFARLHSYLRLRV